MVQFDRSFVFFWECFADMDKNQPKAIASLMGNSRTREIYWGILAFATYQSLLSIVLQTLGLARNLSLFPLELLVFALIAVCLSLYSTVLMLRGQVSATINQDPDEQRRIHAIRIGTYLSKKLGALCQGIDHSLSAIMFFARAQLG